MLRCPHNAVATGDDRRVDGAPLVLFTPSMFSILSAIISYHQRKAPGKAAGLPGPLQHSLQVSQKLVKFIKSADRR